MTAFDKVARGVGHMICLLCLSSLTLHVLGMLQKLITAKTKE
jgi:hypothetical protein